MTLPTVFFGVAENTCGLYLFGTQNILLDYSAMRKLVGWLALAVLAVSLAACDETPEATFTHTPKPTATRTIAVPEPVPEAPETPADPQAVVTEALLNGDWETYCGTLADSSVSGYDPAVVGTDRVAELRATFYDSCMAELP